MRRLTTARNDPLTVHDGPQTVREGWCPPGMEWRTPIIEHILPDVTILLRVMLGLGVSVVSDAERYPGGNGITSGSIVLREAGRTGTASRCRPGNRNGPDRKSVV